MTDQSTVAPTPRELAAEDARARLLSKREFERPLALEAGAGTGKTATLVARVVCWTLGPGWCRAREELRANSSDISDDRIAAKVLEGVVAITFTEKAAAEMAERCAHAFEEISRGRLPVGLLEREGENDWDYLCREGRPEGPALAREIVRQRAAELAQAPEHLSTRTIHSFCRALLARHPLEAKLAPGFEVDADGSRAEALARDVLETLLRDVWNEPDDPPPGAPTTLAADVIHLLSLGQGPAELEQALSALFAAGATGRELARSPMGTAAIEHFCARTRSAFEALRTAGLDRIGSLKYTKRSSSPDTIQACAASEAVLLRTAQQAPSDATELEHWIAEILAPWSERAFTRLGDWSRLKSFKTEAAALLESTPLFARRAGELRRWLKHLRRVDIPLLVTAQRVLAQLLAALEERMAQAGVASFGTLLAATGELLSSHGAVCAEERRRMQLLLVDEFQDTDQTQCAIVRELALKGPSGERPALFLVGDPKQSIYGWRRADLDAYESFLGEVVAAGGSRLPLAVNFRSYPAILDEVSRVVQPVMQHTRGLQPAFQPLLPRPGLEDDPAALPGDRQHVEHWASWVFDPTDGSRRDKPKKDETFEVEARAIAADLVDLHAQGMAWGEAALLVRATTSLKPYLDALRGHGIPFDVRGDKDYYRRREVVDAIALVRAVLDPNDHLALVTLLRSAWVGVPDAALPHLFGNGALELLGQLCGRDEARLKALGDMARRIATEIGDVPGIEAVQRFDLGLVEAARGLGQARQLFATGSAVEFVEGLRLLFLSEPMEAERNQGERRLPNLERFYSDLMLALDEHDGDAQAVLRRLRRDLVDGRDAEEAKAQDGDTDAVEIMTIHRAKGLDFEHVYLPQLHKGQRDHRPPTFAFEHLDQGVEYVLFGAPSLGFAEVEARAERREAAERVRLFYVATTRARRRLVLLSRWDTSFNGPWLEAQNFDQLLALQPGLQSGLLGLRSYLDKKEGAQHTYLDPSNDVLWRIAQRYAAQLAQSVTCASESAQPAQPAPDLDTMLARARELIEIRRAALAHQRREWRLQASAAAHGDRTQGHPLHAEVPGDESGAPAMDTDADHRAAARLAGTALHAGLEEVPLDSSPDAAVEFLRRRALEFLEQAAAPTLMAAATERVRAVCRALEGGQLLGRLLSKDYRVIARELPLLLAPRGATANDPVGHITGSVDLVLQDRRNGDFIVVDYKSDVVGDAGAADLASAYGPQLRLYGEALWLGLGLAAPPRLEAWFLGLDRAEVLTP